MGTIAPRKRQDGTTGYTARIRMKRAGAIVYEEAETFNRKAEATAWLRKREAQMSEPGALEKLKAVDPLLSAVIDRYLVESIREIGGTKAQVLRTIKASDLGGLVCSKIGSPEIVSFARGLEVQPQTRGNYMSHLSAVVAVAQPAWDYPLSRTAMADAFAVLKRLGLTSKSKQRDRRPTLAELDAILTHFTDRRVRRPDSAPMTKVIGWALFSTRRMEEITRATWADFDPVNKRVKIRDMKNPGEKAGNDVWCDLPDEAIAIMQAMPRVADQIFPYTTDAIGAAFTRAVALLGIEDLHFHDLRHEGISRLFEMGWTIPRVATVSGHRSWQSLQRYAHLREVGDKFKDWPWLARLSEKTEK